MNRLKFIKGLKKYGSIICRIASPIVVAVVSYRAGKKMLEAKYDVYDAYVLEPGKNLPVSYEELSKEDQKRIRFRIMFPVYAITLASILEGYFDKMSDLKEISQLSKAYGSLLISNVMYQKALEKENPDAAAEIESNVNCNTYIQYINLINRYTLPINNQMINIHFITNPLIFNQMFLNKSFTLLIAFYLL